MNTFQKFYLATIVLVFVLFVGWIMNIVKLIHIMDGGLTAELVVRGIGVFAAPLGGIAGFF